MRTVVRSSEVPHLWAHAKQATARNSTGSFFFERDTIYSYRRSYPLARRYVHRHRGVFYLIHPGAASVTTSGHKNQVLRALPVPVRYGPCERPAYFESPLLNEAWGDRVFTLPSRLWDDLEAHKSASTVAFFNRALADLAARVTQPRTRASIKARFLSHINFFHAQWLAIHSAFGLRCSTDAVKLPASIDALASYVAANRDAIDRAEERAREGHRRRELKRTLAAKARQRHALTHLLPLWRNNTQPTKADLEGPDTEGFVSVNDISWPVLRIDPSDPTLIQTSLGATIPLTLALACLRRIPDLRTLFSSPPLFHDNTLTLEHSLADYGQPVLSYVHFRLGCHRVPWEEIVAFLNHIGEPVPSTILSHTNREPEPQPQPSQQETP